tara:strand:+ start:563 stop:1336 length:774 start_codon:yes stop_codon:yes gene_type:complete
MNQLRDDEIDIYEFLNTLWQGKFIIILLTIIFSIIGIVNLSLKEPAYESKMLYAIDTMPPFYDDKKGLRDFHVMFYSEEVFNNWKSNNNEISIKFADFTPNQVVDGFVLTKDEDSRLAVLVVEKLNHNNFLNYVVLKTDQLKILNDFYNYTNHINEELKSDYVLRAKEELKYVKESILNSSIASDAITTRLLEIDRYIETADNGGNVLSIQRPMVPNKISDRGSIVIATHVIIGGIIGICLVFIQNAFRKRKVLKEK